MKWLGYFLCSMLFASFVYGAGVKPQTITGSIQGLGFGEPLARIEIASGGRGTIINLGSPTRLKEIGLTEGALAMGTKVTATGRLKKGKAQDELEADLVIIDGRTYKLK